MNDLPTNWAAELKGSYPAKSGPVGWASTKLLLALRRALMRSTWGEIIDGCKRYKAYCEQSGKENTEFVQSPLRFIEDGCHLEEFTYQAPQTKEQQELAQIRARDATRLERAVLSAKDLGLSPMAGESVGSFETRVSVARRDAPAIRSDQLGSRISDLAGRLRVAK